MAKRKWRNIDPLKASDIMLRPGMTPEELIELWEGHHIQILFGYEWLDNLSNEYIYGEIPNEG